jgi:hypothetical protein
MENEINNSFKFKYVFDDDYNPKYVNGAFGGVNPQGEINLNFYMERFAIPKKEQVEIDSQSNITNVTHEPEDVDSRFIRFIQCGITMNRERAQEIYEFLGQLLSQNEGE